MSAEGFAVSVLLWLVGLFLMWKVPSPASKERAEDRGSECPRVSIIIPARNEAQRISPLLASLGRQTRRPHEIVVVDDCSSDGTSDVARRMGTTVLAGQPLPAGWTGKTWACWQGAQHSTGELLLFLDADTWLEPDALAELVEEHECQMGLLTVQPYHVTSRVYEQLSAFFNIVLMAAINAFTPLRNVLRPGGGFGPCVICSRKDYFRVGGHSSIKGHVLEDIAMAKRFLAHGVPVACYGGRGVISFRMYPAGLGDLIEGWSKGFGLGALSVHIPFLVLTVAWITGCFRVWVGLAQSVCAPAMPGIELHAFLYALYALQIRWMLVGIGRFRWWTPMVFPIPLVFFALIMLRSVILIHIWRRVKWKGRIVPTSRQETRR